MNNFLHIAAATYLLAAILMFLIPESWFPKKPYYKDMGISETDYLKTQPKQGYYRKLFLLTGLIVLAVLFLVKYIIL
jgi:hypothetical protein